MIFEDTVTLCLPFARNMRGRTKTLALAIVKGKAKLEQANKGFKDTGTLFHLI